MSNVLRCIVAPKAPIPPARSRVSHPNAAAIRSSDSHLVILRLCLISDYRQSLRIAASDNGHFELHSWNDGTRENQQ